MNRARLAVGQTASNLLYLALNYYRAATDNGHGGVHGKRLNRTMDLDRPPAGVLMRTDFTRAKRARVRNADADSRDPLNARAAATRFLAIVA